MELILLHAPPPVVPAIIVAAMAMGTALGFYIARLAIDARPTRTALGDDRDSRTGSAVVAIGAIAALSPADDPLVNYRAISRILRAYLDERFSIDTRLMLGADIERAIASAGYPRATGRLTAHLLERCARAQSAATPVESARMADDLRVAREVIALTSSGR